MRVMLLVVYLVCFFYAMPSYSQQKKDIKIGLLSDSFYDDLESDFERFKKQIVSVVGEKANIHFNNEFVRSNKQDIHLAEKNYNEYLESKDVDLILAFGPILNHFLLQQTKFPKPVVLIGATQKEFMTLPKVNNGSGIENLTYLVTPESLTQELDVFHQLFPYKKLGVIVDQQVYSLFPIKKILDNHFSNKNFGYKIIPVSKQKPTLSDEDFAGIDAVYLSNNIWYSEDDFKQLLSSINKLKLPSFSAMGRKQTTYGTLFTHSSNYNSDSFMRRIALSIEAIVDGTNPKDIPVTIDYEKRLTLNIETAFSINFPLRYSQLLQMEVIGDPNKIYFEKKYSLESALQQALENNLSLKSDNKSVEISKKDVQIAKSNYLPDVSASAQGIYLDPKVAEISRGSNPELKTDGSLVLKQVIFSEEASAGIAIKKEQQKAQQANYDASELDLILNCSVAYFNALIAKNNLKIQDENLKVTRKNFDIAQQNYEAGQSGKTDVLRLSSEVASATQSVVQAQTQFIISLHELNQLLNNPVSLKIDIESINLESGRYDDYDYQQIFKVIDDPMLREKFVAFLIQEARTNAPELHALDYNLKAAQRATALYKRSKFLPTLALQGQYNYTMLRKGKGNTYPTGFTAPPDGTYNVGLNLSIPIFQQNLRNLNRQKSLLQEQQIEIQYNQVIQTLSRNVSDGILNLVAQITNIEISKISAQSAKESLELTQVGYSNGAVNITSLIDAQRAYIQAQQQQSNAIYNYLIAATQLERIIGFYFVMNNSETNQAFINRFKQFALIDNQ